mmetsp:Transcript_1742/g.5310  ORF Transcript_1742/g.5310 Transcript_1742/m.5310 type:complete len:85 (+) Transcript_1742:2053-2307(+)
MGWAPMLDTSDAQRCSSFPRRELYSNTSCHARPSSGLPKGAGRGWGSAKRSMETGTRESGVGQGIVGREGRRRQPEGEAVFTLV